MGVSRRRFIQGTGAAVLAAGAGVTANQWLDDEEEWSAEPRQVPETAPRELEPILTEIAHYQKYRIESFNDRMAENDFRPPYDEQSPYNTVSEHAGDGRTDTFDIYTNVRTAADSAYDDIAQRLELENGAEEAETILGGGMAMLVDPLLYVPVAGKEDDDAPYDPHHYEAFEEHVGAINCTVHDHDGATASVYLPPDTVTELRSSVAENGKEQSFQELLGYVQDNTEYELA